ncbi:MAG: hypothetical protein J6Y92_03665 [Lentisphaeria bacterium]|nr:hypothetical protein [Lentisphaeria bacterium]
MGNACFKFPRLNGGCSSGLNNAGIETFKSDPWGKLARECAQNSLDARIGEAPAKLVFRFHEIPKDNIPGINDLREAFIHCKEYWNHEDSQEYKFSNKALEFFDQEKIPVLEISDYNTTGLHGEDKERGSAWHALVMSAGECNKSVENAGGFGIGKSAPFAVSAWRTVFYSSLTPEGDYAFRGVCYNMTHLDQEGKETQGIGYYGDIEEDGTEILSIRDHERIPKLFCREKEKSGTSIFVLAFSYMEGYDLITMQAKLKHAVLENFWPAIYFGKICFIIGNEDITKDNLAEYMAKDEGLKMFMQCMESSDKVYAKEKVGRLGECELYFLLTDDARPELVCTRASRMKIQSISSKWGLEGIGFVGLFSCLSPEGNRILKNMEPPEHNRWDSGRSNGDDNTLSERGRKEVLSAFKRWVKNKILEQAGKIYTGETDLEDVGRLFNNPDPPKDSTPSGNEAQEEDTEKNHNGFTSSIKKIKVSKIVATKQKRFTDVPPPASYDGETEENGENGEGNSVVNPPQGHGHNGEKSIDPVPNGEDGGAPGSRKIGSARKIKFVTRGFVQKDEYVLILKTHKEFHGDLLLLASGEEDSEELEITAARTDACELSVQNGKIVHISISPDTTSKIYAKTRDSEHFSVEVIGYELN